MKIKPITITKTKRTNHPPTVPLTPNPTNPNNTSPIMMITLLIQVQDILDSFQSLKNENWNFVAQ